MKKVLAVLAFIGLLVLMGYAGIMKAQRCEEAGGVYLSRDNVCIRAEVIKP